MKSRNTRNRHLSLLVFSRNLLFLERHQLIYIEKWSDFHFNDVLVEMLAYSLDTHKWVLNFRVKLTKFKVILRKILLLVFSQRKVPNRNLLPKHLMLMKNETHIYVPFPIESDSWTHNRLPMALPYRILCAACLAMKIDSQSPAINPHEIK